MFISEKNEVGIAVSRKSGRVYRAIYTAVAANEEQLGVLASRAIRIS